jgi:alkylation response protein AidB-like acyl-CoA dehydrogenase
LRTELTKVKIQAEEEALTVTNLSTQIHPPHKNTTPKFEPIASSAHNAIDLLERVAETIEFCAQNAAAIDFNGAFPIQEFEQIASAGLLTASLPTSLGGVGLGIDTSSLPQLLTLLKNIGRANLAVGRIYEGHVNALQLIQTFGTPEQIVTYAQAARRHKIFGVWNAEAADGVKIMPLGNGKYRLEGAKTFATGCGYVDRPFINGALPNGAWQMCIVPMDEVATAIDSDWWQPAGMRATASFKVDVTGVILDESELIGQPGDYYRQPWLSAGVVRFAAVQLGGAEALFNSTRQFLQSLERIKDPYQEQRLGQMAIAIESGHLWLAGAATQLERYAPSFAGDPSVTSPKAAALVAYANMVRTAIEQICMDAIQLAERSVGTRGLLPPEPTERIIRDLTLYLRQPAFDAALASVGRHALQTAVTDPLWTNEPPTRRI